jgi:hypothetical protein
MSDDAVPDFVSDLVPTCAKQVAANREATTIPETIFMLGYCGSKIDLSS